MSTSSSHTRRSVLAATAAAGAFGLATSASTGAFGGAQPGEAAEDSVIRPFHVNFPEEAIVDLRRRHCGDTMARP